jgi:hypothetical protein
MLFHRVARLLPPCLAGCHHSLPVATPVEAGVAYRIPLAQAGIHC